MGDESVNVCIVDDAAINLTLMEALIAKIDDCRATCFSDPIAALQYCVDEPIDLLIVDYMMPELDGIEFIKRLRMAEQRHEVPILMVTADHEKEVRHRALQSGATDFLTKPLDRIEFISRVRNMLDIRRSHLLLADRAAMLAEEVRKATAEIFAREREAIFRLSKAAEFRDPETGAHILRMAHYSELIARRLGWNDDQAEMMLQAAPMHDVGKLGTPDYILLKPGRLSHEEFEVMKRHAVIGWEILRDSASPVLQMAAEIAISHHEKFDGSGYPSGLAGDAIPQSGRIVAVADVFDALTSARPYKAAWPIERALGLLRDQRGHHFDPICIDAFLAELDAVLEIRDRYQDQLEDDQ